MSQQEALKRLEAVTSRLERIASKLGRGGGNDDDDDESPIYVGEFESIINKELADVLSKIDKLKIPEVSKYFKAAYNNIFELIKRFNTCKKPDPQSLMSFLAEASKAIGDSDSLSIRGKSKKDYKKFADHYKGVKESILLCAWVSMAPPAGLPLTHVETQMGAADFNLNRVLKNCKDNDNKDFVKSLKVLNKAVYEYVKNNFKKGIDWNPKGVALSKDAPAAGGQSKGASEESKDDKQKPKSKNKNNNEEKKEGDVGKLFGELNKGTGITKGLNKVKKSQKNKYKKDKISGKVTVKSKKITRKKFGKPNSALKGGRWLAENYDEGIVTIKDATLKNQVYIACNDNTTFDVQGKVKSVTIDDCRKSRIFLDEVVSVVEIVNCKSINVICRNVTPSITIEKSESVSVRLEKKAFDKNPDIYTSNISAVNIETPDVNNDGEYKEYAVPEQFLFKVDNKTGKSSINATEH